MESVSAFSSTSETCGVICAMTTSPTHFMLRLPRNLTILPRFLHSSKHRPALVHRFFKFFSRIGIRHNPRAHLQISFLAFHHHGADGNARIQIPREVSIEN